MRQCKDFLGQFLPNYDHFLSHPNITCNQTIKYTLSEIFPFPLSFCPVKLLFISANSILALSPDIAALQSAFWRCQNTFRSCRLHFGTVKLLFTDAESVLSLSVCFRWMPTAFSFGRLRFGDAGCFFARRFYVFFRHAGRLPRRRPANAGLLLAMTRHSIFLCVLVSPVRNVFWRMWFSFYRITTIFFWIRTSPAVSR